MARAAHEDADGFTHQSAGEAQRADELLLLMRAGEIRCMTQQPRVELMPGYFYKPDFVYQEGRTWIWEDSKGPETERFRTNCRLWKFFGPGMLRVTKAGRRGSVVVREIVPLHRLEALRVLRKFIKERVT
jgi:hypothetical protein